MNRQPLVLLCAVVCSTFVFADEKDLKEARQRWLRGNYAEALERYQTLGKDEKLRVDAVVGESRCLKSQGEYDKALEVVEKLLKDQSGNVKLLARQAELLYQRGRWDDAGKAAKAVTEKNKDNFTARWVLAQILRDRGDTKQADVEFRWFVKTFSQRSDMDKDITDPDELLIVGLAGSENASWNRLSDQFEVILQDVYGDVLKQDKDYWP